jgi:hypothetical protein
MDRVTLAIVTVMPLLFGLAACSEEEANRAGEQVEETLKTVSETAQNAAETAGDKIEQWTDRGSSEEQAEREPAGAIDQRPPKQRQDPTREP